MIINKEVFIIANDSIDYSIKLEQEIAKMKEENEKLRKALAFYAENKNWEQREIGSKIITAIDPVDHWQYVDKWGDTFWIGGKLASEALGE